MGKFEAGMEGMIDTYVYETTTLMEQLDQILIKSEAKGGFDDDIINEIFRIMHTVKGSSAMMGLENMATLAHSMEDLFFIIREEKPVIRSYERLFGLIFSAADLLSGEIDLLQDDSVPLTDFSAQVQTIKEYEKELRSGIADGTESAEKTVSVPVYFERQDNPSGNGESSVKVYFEDGIEMENLRALLLVNNLADECTIVSHVPEKLENNSDAAEEIVQNGFIINFVPVNGLQSVLKVIESSGSIKTYEILNGGGQSDGKAEKLNADLENLNLNTVPDNDTESAAQIQIPESEQSVQPAQQMRPDNSTPRGQQTASQPASKGKQSLISVNLNKLDQLLDMVGEIVITEAMVISNPDLKGLRLDDFQKAARQLRKLTDELQDIVMSIRMVPISGVFNKMTRIVRDMKVKLGKEVNLEFEGETTEVDKSVIDGLFDPLMHMVRNSMDHGIENTAQERIDAGKPPVGTVTLSAYSTSGEVIIAVSDDGGGINCEKVLAKAAANGLLTKPESDYTDKEIFGLLMLPGFSTNEEVTEFSGRGVGMDVVKKNIEKIGGSVSIESKAGVGTDFIVKIPLSLAIVDGIEVSVGESIFTIPMGSIKESIKIKGNQLVKDTSGREMVMLRGACYPLMRLYEIYGLEPKYSDPYDGMVMVVEAEGHSACILVDELIGEQQVVVKPFSAMLNRYDVKRNGMAGCTILGDGSITIILDVSNIILDK
ncbi:MAG: chemotaxis protein CheA [Oscillospiraceae bacterium]|jgi:two-component system chemotaxis sensor kinase CheA|nr:chemotaxis protein CheA [Oscillospiraceae bacterium]